MEIEAIKAADKHLISLGNISQENKLPSLLLIISPANNGGPALKNVG